MSWHWTWGLACCNQVEVNKREIYFLIDSCWWRRSAVNAILLMKEAMLEMHLM